MIDNVDMKILNALKIEGRASYRQLGEELGLAPGTISARVDKLKDKGIIQGFSVIIDYEYAGYDLTVIIEVVVSKGKLIETEQEIAKFPQVCAVYDVTGTTDIIVVVKVKNRSELSHLIKTMLAMEYVERTNSHVVLTTVKEDFVKNPSNLTENMQ
ncbi:MAG: Lrp/AsnC family transcriptional regulator [Candidatus Thorarchaeota archaeon]